MKNTLRPFFSWSGLFAILLLVLASAYGFGQNFRSDGVVQARSGVPAPGALVAVCSQPCTVPSNVSVSNPPSPLASLCSSASDAVCASPNPVTADGLGNYHFYVKPGKYSVVFYGSGLTASTQTDQIFPCDPSNCSFSGNVLVGGTLGVTGVETDTNVNGIRFANGFPGTGATQINNAENDCGTNSCVVFVPSTVAAGAGQVLLTKDNVFVMDARSPAANAETQNTSLLFNIKDTALNGVRTKMFLVDPVQPASVMQPGNTSSTWYVHTFAEGNIAGFGTIEATNGTITVDTGTTGSPTAAVGVEAECFVSGTVANTITSCRGGTYNVGLTGAGSITNGVAIQAQAAVKSGSGTITNAVGLLAENQTVGSTNNLGIWDQGQSAFDKPMSIGNLGNGTSPQAGTMLFVRPLNGDLSGTVQAGIQAAPVTSSAATAIGVGVRARADTFAAAYVQALNQGLRVDTPTVGAGSTVTEWDGLDVEAAPTAGTKCSIKLAGSSSGTTCINTPSVTGGSMTILPINNGTVAKVFVASDFTTANNTSLQAITGLSFVFPAVAGNYNFHCALSYSQATAAVADAFGIQAATNNPTNIFANGAVYTAAGVSTSGTLATLATTSATNIVTFTPGATATNNVAYLDGTLELGASANTINIMVSTSTGADAVTVKRGSYCSLY